MKTSEELNCITDLIKWAHANGALHIKTPYIEMVFPPPGTSTNAASPQTDVQHDNLLAEQGLASPRAAYKSPLDDPDYYAEQQETFYGSAVKPSEPR